MEIIDYTTIDKPYDPFLERSDQNLDNGNVMNQSVKSGGDMGDIWIRNFIRSESWKPKSVGFYINGQTGYAEFMNVFISGEIQAMTGTIGGFIIGSDYIKDITGFMGLSSAVTAGDDVRFWAGGTTPSIAPFNVTESGNTRVNVLTNKSIFFETITDPAVSDGQMWCALNGTYKVLWGYFGGLGTKQQISMSKMFAYNDRDNDNTGGGSTMTYDLEIPTWFQPRMIDAKGFIIDAGTTTLGVTYGFAQNGQAGVNTGFRVGIQSYTNVVSNLSLSVNTSNISYLFGSSLTTNNHPLIPATIVAGSVTSYYDDSGKDLVVAGAGTWAVNTSTVATSLNQSWSNNSITAFDSSKTFVWQQGDCILSDNFNATFTNLNAYAYVLSWTDTKVTIRIVSKVGWRLFAHFNVIG